MSTFLALKKYGAINSVRLSIGTSMRHLSLKSLKNRKVYPSSLAALSDIPDGATVLFGGFGPCGAAENLMKALKEAGPKNLRVLSNNLQGRNAAKRKFMR
jgi:hypothetical protein